METQEALAEMKDLPPDARDEAMRLLLDAACADGRIMEAEREYLRTVASALEIDQAATDRMINVRMSFAQSS